MRVLECGSPSTSQTVGVGLSLSFLSLGRCLNSCVGLGPLKRCRASGIRPQLVGTAVHLKCRVSHLSFIKIPCATQRVKSSVTRGKHIAQRDEHQPTFCREVGELKRERHAQSCAIVHEDGSRRTRIPTSRMKRSPSLELQRLHQIEMSDGRIQEHATSCHEEHVLRAQQIDQEAADEGAYW